MAPGLGMLPGMLLGMSLGMSPADPGQGFLICLFFVCLFLFFWFFFLGGICLRGGGDGWLAWVGCGGIQASPSSGGPVPGFWDLGGSPGVTPQLWEGTRGRRTKQLSPDVRKQSRRGLGSAGLSQGPPQGVPGLRRGLSTWISLGNGRRDRTHQWKAQL